MATIKNWKDWNKWGVIAVVLVLCSFWLPLWELSMTDTSTGDMTMAQEVYYDGVEVFTNILGQEKSSTVKFNELEISAGEEDVSGLDNLDGVMTMLMILAIGFGIVWAVFSEEFEWKKYMAVLSILTIFISAVYFWVVWDGYLETNDMEFFFESGENLNYAHTDVSGNPSWGFFTLLFSMVLMIYASKKDLKSILHKYKVVN